MIEINLLTSNPDLKNFLISEGTLFTRLELTPLSAKIETIGVLDIKTIERVLSLDKPHIVSEAILTHDRLSRKGLVQALL